MKYSIVCSMLFFVVLASCHREEIIEKTKDEPENLNLTKSMEDIPYYWHNEEKIFLTPIDDKFYILYEDSNEASLKSTGINTGLQVLSSQELVLSSKIIPYNKSNDSKGQITKHYFWSIVSSNAASLEAIQSNIIYAGKYFTNSDGEEVGLSHLFYVKLKKEADLQKLEKLAEAHNVEILGNNEYMPLWYTLACSKESSGNSLEMANLFYESNLFTSCQPDLLCDDDLLIVNDPYYSEQWHLNNTSYPEIDINFEAARTISTGNSDIIVAVLDEGVQLDHPDLNILNISYDTETGQASKLYGDHGTRCAGLISAKTNNRTGVASIASSCRIMSISNSLISTPDSRQKRADGINFAVHNGASVISNSWSSSVPYQIIDDAISNALTTGRNGKGCVVVFATGNDYANTVSYPANSNPYIIAVGAVSKTGNRAYFSNYGTALDVVAPGENIGYTTDLDSKYISNISGTSFSCPLVAGIAALILSVNPNLTQREVANIIERTARKIGGYDYESIPTYKNGTWNKEMGYGLVDAHAAVIDALGGDTTYFNNQRVISDTKIYGNYISSENVTVSSNAELIFDAKYNVQINNNFTVNGTCLFEIQ